MDDRQLQNHTHHLTEDAWEPYEDCPPITKSVLDDQQVDELSADCTSNADASGLLPTFQPDVHINLHYVRAYYCGPQLGAGNVTRVSERPHIMQWRGEHFKCRVGISFEAAMPRSCWTVGLAQACDYITLRNTFQMGGAYCWEFQPIKSGLHSMVNDSNGSQWPFYSHRSSMIDIQSGQRTRPGMQELRFSDYFYPTMHWEVETGGRNYALTNVVRRQGFKVWLLAIRRGAGHAKDGFYSRYLQFCPQQDEVHVLRAMQWRYNIERSRSRSGSRRRNRGSRNRGRSPRRRQASRRRAGMGC